MKKKGESPLSTPPPSPNICVTLDRPHSGAALNSLQGNMTPLLPWLNRGSLLDITWVVIVLDAVWAVKATHYVEVWPWSTFLTVLSARMSLVVSVLDHIINIIVKVIIFVCRINISSRLCHHQLFIPDISDQPYLSLEIWLLKMKNTTGHRSFEKLRSKSLSDQRLEGHVFCLSASYLSGDHQSKSWATTYFGYLSDQRLEGSRSCASWFAWGGQLYEYVIII